MDLRQPESADAAGIWRLVRESGVLEPNSCYAYLLMTTHFSKTCVVAEWGEKLAGFVTAYYPPSRPGVLFVWQMAVAEDFRGRNLALRMLKHLLLRNAEQIPEYLEATVTPSNMPSRKVFTSLAAEFEASLSESPGFVSTEFPLSVSGTSGHEDECLIRIGPLGRSYGDV